MAFINIFVTKNAYLSVKNNQLFLESNGLKVDYPLEDINSIMIENLETTISTYTLSQFAQKGILTFICDKEHTPCGIVLPYCQHYQTLNQYNLQVNASRPLIKQIWQSIIKNKIHNQNIVLNIFGGKDKLLDLKQSVLSGDTTNNEASASLIYFKELFGKNFIRREDNAINSFLNYGYSIIRGFVCRSIVCHGLMPFMGIFHSNGLNQFNLADDLIEIFRPVVDYYVKQNLSNEESLTTKIKGQLYNLINIDVKIDGQKQPVSYAIDLLVQMYVKCLRENKNVLKQIEIIGLQTHSYE